MKATLGLRHLQARIDVAYREALKNLFTRVRGRSEKVGQGLRYHAARRTAPMLRTIRWWAKRVTRENKPKSAGVVRLMAISDHCLCVSTPRCRRASWKVLSICQRKTNHLTICSGSAPRSVHSTKPGWRTLL
jgi:hypothetical protein